MIIKFFAMKKNFNTRPEQDVKRLKGGDEMADVALVRYDELNEKAKSKARTQLREALGYKQHAKLSENELIKALFDEDGNLYAY